MLEYERRELIRRLLDLRSIVAIHDVVEATGASEATIRRDFTDMENEGLLKRIRGGVEQNRKRGSSVRPEPPLDWRLSVNREKKRLIAKKACSFVEPRSTLLVDGGSTTFQMTEFLSTMEVTVVTNSFAIAEHLVTYSRCRVIVPEGTVDPGSRLIIHNLNPDPFANFNASIAIMGIEGITDSILTNLDPLLIQMERSMIAHARELFILADETKFGKIGHLTLCPVERASRIITTRFADAVMVKSLTEKGVQVIQV